MSEWYRLVQTIVEEVDKCIMKREDEALTLSNLSKKLGCSEFYIPRKFREISGMHFRDYLRNRTLAFALKEVRDTSKGLLEIALDYGFSGHEAFSRSFKEAYGITPSEYSCNPVPVVLRTIIKPFDCYLISIGGIGMADTEKDVIVFEHGPFDYQTQNCNVEQKIEEAMKNFDYAASGYCLDTTQGKGGYEREVCSRLFLIYPYNESHTGLSLCCRSLCDIQDDLRHRSCGSKTRLNRLLTAPACLFPHNRFCRCPARVGECV